MHSKIATAGADLLSVNPRERAIRAPFVTLSLMRMLGLTTALASVVIVPVKAASADTPGSTAAVERKFTLNIPAQKLSSALVALSNATGTQLAYTTQLSNGLRSSAISGIMSVNAALAQILSGTGLTYRFNGNTVVLTKASANITLGPVRVGGTVTHQDPTGPGVGYVATTTISGTKTDTPITEIPNSIYVVTKQLMQDQQPQNVVEALRYTPGVYSESLGNYQNGSGIAGDAQGIKQRGFDTSNFVDGLQLNSASAGETAFIERIEAINGPASVMYGQTNPGGMISTTLKKPTDVPLHQVSVGFGSWGRYEATADVSDKITKSGNLRYRVAAIGVTSGTQVDHIDYHRVGVLPSITWDIDPKTSLTLLGMYMYTPGDGINYLQYPTCGTLIQNENCRRIPRNTFTGYKSFNEEESKEAMFEYIFKHEFNKYISFSQTFRYENSHSETNDVYSRIGVSNSEVGVRPWSINSRSTTIGLDSRLYGKFSTGPLKHTWIVGSDFRQLEYMQNAFYDYTQTYTQNLYNPTTNTPVCVNIHSAACEVYGSTGPYNYFQEGVYFQDQIKWKGLSVLLGGREDWVNYNMKRYSVNNDNAAHTITKSSLGDAPAPQHAFTWRAGLIYNTKFGLSPYFSYSTSFVPQAGQTNYQGKPLLSYYGKADGSWTEI